MLLFLACTADPVEDPPDTGGELTLIPLEGAPLLRRLSLDLRGVVPTLAELESVEADPSAIDDLVDVWLVEDSRVEERLVDLYAEYWLTRADEYFSILPGAFQLEPEIEHELELAIGSEPLRLIAHIVASDAPWSDIVTADYTRANAILAQAFPLTREEGEGWTTATWNDERPAMGVLASSGLWLRYSTAPGNLNRRRALTVADLVLCEDYLERPVDFDAPSLLDTSGIEDAVRSNPACLTCHSTLDPLASLLFGFWVYDRSDAIELVSYHAERESLGAYYLGVDGGWFGESVEPSELGEVLAADPRVNRCAVETLAQLMWRRPVELDDHDVLYGIVRDDAELRGHDLLRAVTATLEYRVGALEGPDALVEDSSATPRRILSDSQLRTALGDLTGFTWISDDDIQLMLNDELGYRVLAGGVDGATVTQVRTEPTVSRAFTLQRFSEAAALHGIDEGTLGIDASLSPDDAGFSEQLVDLHRRLHGTTPDEDLLAADEALWSAIEATDGADEAWRMLVAAMLQDPAFWVY